ncbi:MAG: hypothetical protein M1497_15970 [Nitrospirae bacterium]|nr:hypothetical protein [Nitrospirota bacterium]
MSRKRLIDTELYFDTELYELLGCEGLHLYIRLWGLADDSGVYEPRYADIALQMGALHFTPEKVKKYIDVLTKAGKIIPYSANGKGYHWLKNFLKHQPLSNPSLPKYPLPGWMTCEQREYPSGKKYATYQILPEKLAEVTSSLPIVYSDTTGNGETKRNETETRRKLREGFSLFYEAYPKKLKKAKAWEAWQKINPENGTFELIMDALKRFKETEEWRKDSGKYVPHPTSWLNQRRWEDEIPEEPTKQGRPIASPNMAEVIARGREAVHGN